MNIREYNSNDLHALVELMGELGYPTEEEILKKRMERIEYDPMCFTFVAEVHSQVVGMIGIRQLYSYEIDEVATQINALVTKKEYQRKGIGTALILYVEEWTRNNGSETIVLNSGIKESRKAAHEFYKALGFEVTGYRFIKMVTMR
ncbi:GNAT family N-acetyltransferase [Paenibacillus camelliae]|uniref:GNAT family N-acetyltransferase n=1 Tax=Paenibacillus camelliae TaxID=512410 RepID=UPI00203EA856|nr:GNAT family N-acetyltransferase [Paenibacillus camelliae]MCM3633589.1 GNAT family N-acetyltransferase [Paenibacillus camelliae]